MAGADVLAATVALLQQFNWKTLSLVCDFMSQNPGLSNFYFARCNDIRHYLITKGFNHYYVQFDSAKEHAFSSYLGGLKNRSRSINDTALSGSLDQLVFTTDTNFAYIHGKYLEQHRQNFLLYINDISTVFLILTTPTLLRQLMVRF